MAETTEAPAKGATRADWDAYAKDQGLTDDEIAGYTTKPALQEALAARATDADATGSDGDDPTSGGVAPATPPPNATTLDKHLDAPSTMAPGDAPADTTDPDERASSAPPDFAAAAAAGHDTVNAVVPRGSRKAAAAKAPKHRIEQYDATRPDGKIATVEHNIDTGDTKILGVRDPE